MRILIDTTTLISPKSGVGHYTSKISSALLSNKDFETSFFTSNYFHKNLITYLHYLFSMVKVLV